MAWTVEFDPAAVRQLGKLAKAEAVRIRNFLRDRVALLEDPRTLGQALQGTRFAGVWRYRVGDYRVLCQIQDSRVVILVVAVGNRKDVYR